MSFFDQVYQSLFPKKEQKNKVLLHEVIKRSDAYLTKYNSWNHSESMTDLLNDVRTSYYLKSKGIQGKPDVHLLESQYSNGFAVSFSREQMNQNEFQFLFDWIASSVEKMGYRRSNSDVTIMDKGKFIETREKYYLKPPMSDQVPIDQKYGNILIEYILIDDTPSYLKVLANIYSDRSYLEAKSFNSLAEYLFKVN